jgi:hypothetical protein
MICYCYFAYLTLFVLNQVDRLGLSFQRIATKVRETLDNEGCANTDVF